MKLLTENGQKFSHVTSDIEIVKNIKEKSCYVALDFEEEIKSADSYDYRLPDGNNIKVKDQKIKCSEMLFRPFIAGKEANDFAEICNDSIQKMMLMSEKIYTIVLFYQVEILCLVDCLRDLIKKSKL